MNNFSSFIKMNFVPLSGELLLLLFCVYLFSLASKKYHLFKQILIVLTILLTGTYLSWRAIFTVVPFTTGIVAFSCSVLLLSSEIFGYLQSVVFYILFWRPIKERNIPAWPDKTPLPTIDVFVPTYNEPIGVLRRTLVACTNLDYDPGLLNIYVCDDGTRLEVAKLSKRLKIHYLSRQDNKDAKAGNLNHALACSKGQLVATIDADMVPKSWFIKTMVGFFSDEKMGFVQAPQAFFNPDPFHFNLFSHIEMPNEQDFFMRDIQTARDAYNAVMYVGSNAIFSRQALMFIGGFTKGSITEDVATGMLIQAKGYKTAFVKQILANGLAPESWGELVKQRTRWCRGNIQSARLWNPLTIPGLKPMQRILYLNGVLYWYFGIQKLIYALAPILYLVFRIPTLMANWRELLLFWGSQFVVSTITFGVVARNRRTTFWSHIYETALAPAMAWAAISETLGLRQPLFRVTNKGLTSSKRRFYWGSGIVHLSLLIFTLLGISSAIHLILLGLFPLKKFGFVLFWAAYNLVALLTAVLIVFDRPRRRLSERFAIEVPVEVVTASGHTYRGVTSNISETGAKIILPSDVQLSPTVRIKFYKRRD